MFPIQTRLRGKGQQGIQLLPANGRRYPSALFRLSFRHRAPAGAQVISR
jgi:hypothetical protein